MIMRLKSEFGKMQCLLTGNRFTGVNLHKTLLEFDPILGKDGITLTLVLTVEIDYLEIEDKVKYMQHATIEISHANINMEFLKTIVTEIQNELIRRYDTSQVFKFLELKIGADKLSENQLTERLSRIVSDYDNRM